MGDRIPRDTQTDSYRREQGEEPRVREPHDLLNPAPLTPDAGGLPGAQPAGPADSVAEERRAARERAGRAGEDETKDPPPVPETGLI